MHFSLLSQGTLAKFPHSTHSDLKRQQIRLSKTEKTLSLIGWAKNEPGARKKSIRLKEKLQFYYCLQKAICFIGGFHLIITELKSHMTCYNSSPLIG